MKKIIKIAFDVSTNQSGYAIFVNEKLINSGVVIQPNQSINFAERIAWDIVPISNAIDKFLYPLRDVEGELTKQLKAQITPLTHHNEKLKIFNNLIKDISIICVFESNKIFKSQETKQKLDIYLGVFVGLAMNKLNMFCPSIPKEYKFALPGEWHRLTFDKELPRDEGKELSISRALSIMSAYKEIPKVITDDEADAINIALIADKLSDMGIVKSRRQHKAKRLGEIRPQLVLLETRKKAMEIDAQRREHQGLKPWLSQKLIQYENVKSNIEKLKKEKEDLQSGPNNIR